MIAANTQHTGDRRRDHRGYAETMTSEQLDKLLSEGWLREMVADIRGGNEKRKDDLPYICPHYTAFRNNHRAQADIIPELFTFMTCVDVDDLELVDRAIRRATEVNTDAKSEWHDQVLRIEYSARKKVHIYIRIPKGMTIEEAQQAFCKEIEVPYDESCITPERFIYVTGADEEVYRSPHWLEPMSDEELAERREAYRKRGLDVDGRGLIKSKERRVKSEESNSQFSILNSQFPTEYHGVPYQQIIDVWSEQRFRTKNASRHEASVALARDLYIMTDRDKSKTLALLMAQRWVQEIVEERKEDVERTVNNAADYVAAQEDENAKKGKMWLPKISKEMKAALECAGVKADAREEDEEAESAEESLAKMNASLVAIKLPQGVKDSIEAAGPQMAMPVVTAICPCIGALATGVMLDVHGQKKGLNLISYIVGDYASGKGSIDPVVEAWMSEVAALDKMYQRQEEEFRAKKLAAKNKKEQPENPMLPVRFLTLNNTVANLAERLANTVGKHAFSFTPEADTVAQKWKSTMSDFSVMLRQSYDGSKYEREARSAEAVNVHIEHLLWNVTMCGTPDALYRVVNNYTDGFQSRIAVARTADNTFVKLEDKPHVINERQVERIQQIAHLLPLMQGEVVLPKLEARGREWLEYVRLKAMKNDDRVYAKQRIRVCVTAQRMTCCMMLCKVCEALIQQHGLNGAETQLKQFPNLWKEQLLKAQTPQMLELYDVIANSLIENALLFFRERIECAFNSRNYIGNGERRRMGKNDTIFERLDVEFSFEQALQHSVAIKGTSATRNSVHQMLKNWKNQNLVVQTESAQFRKVQAIGK